MSKREKNPPESQIRILFGNSKNTCAYPECGKDLVKPSGHPSDMPKNIGKIAHIAAASPGGPRYDSTMTSEERRSIDNLILLCGEHHDVIDSQLHKHTTEYLINAKKAHEAKMARAARYAMGEIGFMELEMVCNGLINGVNSEVNDIERIAPAIDINVKIELNNLSQASRNEIEMGLAQQSEVVKFLQAMDSINYGFSGRLNARFKEVYYSGVNRRVHGDDLFSYVLDCARENCGPSLNPSIEAAAIAVVAHLFSICEIFESVDATSR